MALFEERFNVLDKDPEGKKFDRVSRFLCKSDGVTETDLEVDINVDVYKLKVGDKITVALASTLDLAGTADDGKFDQSGRKTLADKYDYVMYGTLFKYADDHSSGSHKVELYASFGGLLMLLKGDPANLQGIDVDMNVFLLVRKVA